ncbi:NAD(P)-binding domain-containing protein [Paenibacillus sp. JNUCC31]|uniref:flavin-containing monooxygenase n=1 Tax=Paenibacillus sp. JNUCC-31 TaxID=2777983 RepID=UPI001785A513|nr:NAD(P)/FAD-dependent oxidoreductase [Paenibacillus sp. JNUCC-31]QOS77442.1 NAD(P)-binding domain-containing protein [Paenibacillus sp. JNUCC-31]
MYDVLVIGAGQAGLATGYYLQQSGLTFLIVDAASSVGESWRKRYDSLKLFTPRMYDGLPGLPLSGDKNGLPSKDEIADYFESYAKQMDFPIKLNCLITRLWKRDEVYYAEANEGVIEARNIIVATGPFQTKSVPHFAKSLSENVIQLHSSEYKNLSQLLPGTTVVVGGGNSGAQIAVELAKDDKQAVYISIARNITFRPLHIMKRSIFWYFEKFGVLRASADRMVGKWLRNQPEYVYGYELKELMIQGKVNMLPRAINAIDNRILCEDSSGTPIDNIIWATGFKRNDGWIDIDTAFNSQGILIHKRGVSPVAGLYFVGLSWQTSRGSALLGWVKYDAQKIINHLIQR